IPCRENVGQQMRLGSVVDHQLVAEFVRYPDRGRDVVSPVAVLAPRYLPAQHPAERLELQVSVDRFALRLGLRLLGLDPPKVIRGIDEGTANDGGSTQPRARSLLLLAVD